MISGGMKSRIDIRLRAVLAAWLVMGGLFCTKAPAQTSPDQLVAFADHLYDSGDYYRAITEYERFLFFHSADAKAPYAGLQIARCYLLGKKPEAARTQLRDLMDRYRGQEEGRQAAWMLEESYRTEGEHSLALDQIDKYLGTYPGASNAVAARIAQGVCHLQEGDPSAAKQALSMVPAASPLRQAADELEKESGRYAQIQHKSPWIAGSLSAVLPGAGQVYIGRPDDAILAFVLNAVLIWGMYESFDNGEDVTGGLLTVVETGWYFGNIYNAVNGAHKYNKREKEQFFRDIEIRYGPVISAGGSPDGVSVGASWSF